VTHVTEDDLDDLEFDTLRTGDHTAAAQRLAFLAESVSGGVSRAKVLLRAGEQWQHAGDHAKAAECYRQAIADGGDAYGDPRAYLADALFELDQKAEARLLLDDIRAGAPRDPEVYRTVAEVLYEQGEAAGAFEWATLGADLVRSLEDPEERRLADDSLEALLRLRYRTRIDLGRPEDEYDSLLDDLLKS
jgi:tetratricopeptide (TPR) repeat protein